MAPGRTGGPLEGLFTNWLRELTAAVDTFFDFTRRTVPPLAIREPGELSIDTTDPGRRLAEDQMRALLESHGPRVLAPSAVMGGEDIVMALFQRLINGGEFIGKVASELVLREARRPHTGFSSTIAQQLALWLAQGETVMGREATKVVLGTLPWGAWGIEHVALGQSLGRLRASMIAGNTGALAGFLEWYVGYPDRN